MGITQFLWLYRRIIKRMMGFRTWKGKSSWASVLNVAIYQAVRRDDRNSHSFLAEYRLRPPIVPRRSLLNSPPIMLVGCKVWIILQGVLGEPPAPWTSDESRFSCLALLRSRIVGPPEFSRPKPSRPKPKMLVPVVELDMALSRPER